MLKCLPNTFKKHTMAGFILVCALALMIIFPSNAYAAGGLSMSTKYPGITVKAGDNLNFSLDFDNANGGGAVALSIASMPEGWEGHFEGVGKEIDQVYLQNGNSIGSATFYVDVPVETVQGDYEIKLLAQGMGGSSTVTLNLTVNEEDLGSSTLTTQYAEQEGSSDTSFSFSTTVQNNTPSEQSYSLSANAPSSWKVNFQTTDSFTQVAAITVDPRSSQGITVNVSAPSDTEAGEYVIPISAVSGSETLTEEVTVVITGTYDVYLSTPSGRLSFDATANKKTDVTLSVTNNGNVDLQNLNLTSSLPDGWVAEFSEGTIPVLEAGATKEITAYITPSENAMSGDYAMALYVDNDDAHSSADFRVSVKTETIWGIVGLLVIAGTLCGLGYIFNKYGRR